LLFGTGDPVAGGRATAFVALLVVFAFDSNNRAKISAAM
jgi:hypothetical protein